MSGQQTSARLPRRCRRRHSTPRRSARHGVQGADSLQVAAGQVACSRVPAVRSLHGGSSQWGWAWQPSLTQQGHRKVDGWLPEDHQNLRAPRGSQRSKPSNMSPIPSNMLPMPSPIEPMPSPMPSPMAPRPRRPDRCPDRRNRRRRACPRTSRPSGRTRRSSRRHKAHRHDRLASREPAAPRPSPCEHRDPLPRGTRSASRAQAGTSRWHRPAGRTAHRPPRARDGGRRARRTPGRQRLPLRLGPARTQWRSGRPR